MAISDAQYAAWLKQPDKHRVMLVVAAYYGGTEYLSSSAFISKATDTPANQPFNDLIIKVPTITGDISGKAAVGELELINDGALDSWITRAWAGYSLKAYFGDKTWAFSDFRLVINGVNDGITATKHDRVALTFKDRTKEFDVDLQTTLVPGTNDIVPIALGNVFNAEPVQKNAATHQYQVHEATCTVSAVRVNGLAVGYTDAGNGTFTLSAAPSGRITCDVTQASNTVTAQINYIAAKVGFTDIDASVAAFPNTDQVGIYFKTAIKASEALNAVLRGVGGFYTFTQLGFLAAKRFTTAGTSVLTILPDDIVENKIRVARDEKPSTKITVNYKRNNTPQDPGTLAGSVTEANRYLYSTEWAKEIATNALVGYILSSEQEPVDSTLQILANAQTEATRRAALRSVKRIVYAFTAYTAPFSVEVGDTVTIVNARFGLSAGVDGVVTKFSAVPTANRIDLEVWV